MDPVIIGVGDVVNRSKRLEDAREPLDLMLDAIHNAIKDAGLSSADAIDSIDVVNTWTWKYDNLPAIIARRLSISPKHLHNTPDGGNQPVKILDDASRRIAIGQTKVALLTGGEALASLSAFAAAKQFPPKDWTPPASNMTAIFDATAATGKSGIGSRHGIGAPVQVYPLYENALRAHRRQSPSDNHRESAEMYAEFAKIAAKNEFAWGFHNSETVQSIGTVSSRNRMICLPYPLLMNALNNVNLAAAVLLTSKKHAKQLGIADDKLAYVLGAAGTSDADEFWRRPNLHTSPAISQSIDAALETAGCDKSAIDLYDFYSCFPVVPKLACKHLGLPTHGAAKPVTLLGGLTSFGGAGNNYSMHAITAMARALRGGNSTKGLILANGGVVSYQHAAVLSRHPRSFGTYPVKAVLPPRTTVSGPVLDEAPNGKAVIETYTVEFDRNNQPKVGHIVGRLTSTGARFLAHHADAETLRILSSREVECIGMVGTVQPGLSGIGINHFSLVHNARL